VEIDPSLLFSGEDDGYWDALDHGERTGARWDCEARNR
jgi:hypothetical protein